MEQSRHSIPQESRNRCADRSTVTPAAQAHKEIFHNEALARIDGLLHGAIQGQSNVPPQNGSDGECWLVGPEPTGAWDGAADALAMFQSGQWLFMNPVPGMQIFDVSAQQFRVFSEGWQKPAAVQEPSGGQVVDSEARAAIGALISALRASGITPSA
ncbi:DUF2793 domain-containing protein [Novosphingobium sp. M1R2S20]|uniref:DUF2793 domain-containing protein n=1 Tax=Novosphingobium rhizovicinum TaxID=3228928 RepID=A0ABV3R994_9SPHN